MPLHAKLSLFAQFLRYFWRTKRKSTETITERCFSCQSKSVCQNQLDPAKNENRPKFDIRPFCTKPFNYNKSTPLCICFFAHNMTLLTVHVCRHASDVHASVQYVCTKAKYCLPPFQIQTCIKHDSSLCTTKQIKVFRAKY